ncbi:MAG: (Fe-S)-binding protein [Candidatus Aminicenantales bacterium]
MTPHQDNNGKQRTPSKAAALPRPEGVQKAVTGFLKKALESGCFEALLVPIKVPETASYAWVLAKDPALLDEANPLPPIMSVQGGRALSSLTKHGSPSLRIGAVLRPCEYRAAAELGKLKQINLDNILLITIDCPGAMPLADYHTDLEKTMQRFEYALEKWGEEESVRPACGRCHRFSLPSLDDPSDQRIPQENRTTPTSVDIHIGLLGESQDQILLIPESPAGQEILEKLGLPLDQSVESWQAKVTEIKKKKEEKRKAAHEEFKKEMTGLDRFLSIFDDCINCHICMKVCPVCYCRQCYFDSQMKHFSPQAYLERAQKRGALRFPLDPLLFHLGRMSHMVLSCVSCGACEDACPVSIPVGKVFSWVADETQPAFNYSAGMHWGESLPLQSFLKDEFCEVETPSECEQTPSAEVKENV